MKHGFKRPAGEHAPKAGVGHRAATAPAAPKASPLPRHRMAGSTGGGEYVTEHHRGAKRKA